MAGLYIFLPERGLEGHILPTGGCIIIIAYRWTKTSKPACQMSEYLLWSAFSIVFPFSLVIWHLVQVRSIKVRIFFLVLSKALWSSSLSEYQHNLFLELYIWMFKKLTFHSQICKGKNNLERYETVARSRFQTLSTFANVESSFCLIEWYLIRIEAIWLEFPHLDPASWTPCPCWPSLQPRWFSRRQLWWSLGWFFNHWSLIIDH